MAAKKTWNASLGRITRNCGVSTMAKQRQVNKIIIFHGLGTARQIWPPRQFISLNTADQHRCMKNLLTYYLKMEWILVTLGTVKILI